MHIIPASANSYLMCAYLNGSVLIFLTLICLLFKMVFHFIHQTLLPLQSFANRLRSSFRCFEALLKVKPINVPMLWVVHNQQSFLKAFRAISFFWFFGHICDGNALLLIADRLSTAVAMVIFVNMKLSSWEWGFLSLFNGPNWIRTFTTVSSAVVSQHFQQFPSFSSFKTSLF